MINQTLTRLRHLRLSGMADALNLQQEQPGTYEGLSFEERLALLVDQEDADRSNKRLARLLRAARFKLPATMEDMDYEQPRGIYPHANGITGYLRLAEPETEPADYRPLWHRQKLAELCLWSCRLPERL